MSKKQPNNNAPKGKSKKETILAAPPLNEKLTADIPFYRKPFFAFTVLAIVCILFYGNTYYNNYCLDDLMVITGNQITLKGYDGIKDLLTKDFLYGFRGGVSNDLAANRWRPLSMVTFAIEIEWFGQNPGISHAINVLLFLLSVWLLFLLAYRYLKLDYWISFFTAFLFAIHPIHTEVVANIKSRDEIFCLFFVLISVIAIFKALEGKPILWIVVAGCSYFLSLISKENSITYMAALPLMLYFFTSLKPSGILKYSSVFIGSFLVYLFIRNQILPISMAEESKELLNNPFLLATSEEKLATKIYLLLINLKLLFFPHPLSFDYSYNQIPYRQLSDPMVWLSGFVYLGLAIGAVISLVKKNLFSFSILLFFITFSISSNLLVEIGTPLGERLLFQPSIAFCLGMVLLLQLILKKVQLLKPIPIVVLTIPFLVVAGYATTSRNRDWKNDTTLNMADIEKCPNSARLSNGAGGAYISITNDTLMSKKTKDSLIHIGIKWLENGLRIHPTFDDCKLNLGVAYSRIDSLEKTEQLWNETRLRAPGHPKFKEYDVFLGTELLRKGLMSGEKDPRKAIYYLSKAVRYLPNNADAWYNLGGAYYTIGDYAKAVPALESCLKINPNYNNAANGLFASKGKLASMPK